jgi:prepilin-type N-terminal cleavage/methylation domain-containing protein
MFRTLQRNQKGFTLIELMIVVVIIGILAALAIPRFMASTTRSKQSEAKEILKQIYTMERAYRQEYDTYWGNGLSADALNPTTFSRIGVEVMPTARYTYSIACDAITFLVTATVANPGLDDDAAPDTWTMDHDGNLVCTSDDAVL